MTVNTRPDTSEDRDRPWHALEADAVTAYLQTRLEQGLSDDEAQSRLERYGPNELQGKEGPNALVRFLSHFKDPLIIILMIAGGIKALFGEWTNAIVIWGVALVNAVIGFTQEAQAENAIAALAKSVTTEALVLRRGKRKQLPSTDLTLGDVVLLTSGDRVPADVRLVAAKGLRVNESALTGESTAVDKGVHPVDQDAPLADRGSMAYAGSFVTAGQGRGVVVAVGNATETGRISKLVAESAGLSTPLTRKFERFSRTLLYIILGLAALIFALGWLQGLDLFGTFEAAVAFAVGAIPEGLPAVVTVTLAIGVSRMARVHAIIRKLPAVETLGSATVICSDKTGTLTENQMTVQTLYTDGRVFDVSGVGYTPEGDITGEGADPTANHALRETLTAGVVCNDAHLEQHADGWRILGDPTEGALVVVGHKAGLIQDDLLKENPVVDSIPFDSAYQYMATLHKSGVVYVKGSAEALLERCRDALSAQGEHSELDHDAIDAIQARIAEFGKRGLRVLVLARKEAQGVSEIDRDALIGLTFVGLQGMIDPPRREATEAVAACRSAGIQVKMITGDHVVTAAAIAKQMGFETDEDGEVVAYTGRDLERLDDDTLADVMERGAVFARVAPEQKLRLVKALQSRGEVVAMTGDGVNDAPALRRADIGVAMGQSGTEVAKEASDMILTDDNFASIEAAVEEGRTVYKNVLRAVAFILPVNGGESMTIFISVALGRVLPILSLQVLWLNMINSVAMTVPLAFEPKSERVMQERPRLPNEPLLYRNLIWRILIVSVFNWALIFGMFEWANTTFESEAVARTMAIQALVAGRIIYLISVSHLGAALMAKLRGRAASLSDVPALALGIVGAVLLQVVFSQLPFMNRVFSTAPLDLNQWLICLAAGLPMIIVAAIASRLDPID